MGVAPVTGEHAEHDGAHDIVSSATTVAGVVERALAEEFFPAATGLEELEKVDELGFAGDGSLGVPLGMKATARSVERPGFGWVS